MKRTVLILLALGVILAGAGLGHAATANLGINANVASILTMSLNPTSLIFNAAPGTPTAPQNLTVTTTGNNMNYQLQLSSTSFTTTGGTQPSTVLQYRLSGTTTWVSAAGTPTNILPAPGVATVGGDARIFEMRLNFPSTAINGNYAATVTITAVAQ